MKFFNFHCIKYYNKKYKSYFHFFKIDFKKHKIDFNKRKIYFKKQVFIKILLLQNFLINLKLRFTPILMELFRYKFYNHFKANIFT